MNVGDSVRVTGVFARSFPRVYIVMEIVNSPDGSTAYILDQDAGGFDAMYLEAV